MSNTSPVSVRFTEEQIIVLDYLIEVEGKRSRGEVIRESVEAQIDFDGLAEHAHFYFEEQARLVEQSKRAVNQQESA